jgi:hypothetical protein
MDNLRVASPFQLFFCMLTLSEHTLLASLTPWLSLLIQFLSAISLSLLIAINAKKLFSPAKSVQNSEI